MNLKGAAIWRRLMVIAFEDVGVADIDAITAVVAASSDAALRKSCGGSGQVAIHLARQLAAAPKDRSADYLVGAKDHPALADFVRATRDTSVEGTLLREMCDRLCRARIVEEMQQRRGTLTAVHLNIVLSVIDGPGRFPLKSG